MFVIQYEPKFGKLEDFVCALVDREIKKRDSEYEFESSDIGLPMNEGGKFIIACRFVTDYEKVETYTYFGIKGITKYNKDDIISTDSMNLIDNGKYKKPDSSIDGIDEIMENIREIEELIYSGEYRDWNLEDSLDDEELDYVKKELGNKLPYPLSPTKFKELHAAVLSGGAAQAETDNMILSIMIHNPSESITKQEVAVIIDIKTDEMDEPVSEYILIPRSKFKIISYDDFCLEIILLILKCYSSLYGDEE